MSAFAVEWKCPSCNVTLDKMQRMHLPCLVQTRWTCLISGRSGIHHTYKKHAQSCPGCSPDQQRHILEEKAADTANRVAAVVEDEKGPSSQAQCLLADCGHSRTSGADPTPTAVLCVVEHPQPPWSVWSQDDFVLHQKTGLHRQDVDWLYEQSEKELLQLRLPMRHRKENVAPCSPHNMLVITLHWLRKYPSFRELQVDTGQTGYNLWKLVHRVVPVLRSTIYSKLVFPVDDSSPLSTRAGLVNVKILVDSTFLPLPKTPFEPKLYHKKSPTKSAWWFEVGCDLSHRIVSVSDLYNGAAHDMRIIRESDLLQHQSETSRIVGDRGYRGKLGIVHPLTKRKKVSRELQALQDEKASDHELETERATIENINARLKEWAVVKGVWRGGYRPDGFINDVVRVVCALTNLIFHEHPIRLKKQPNKLSCLQQPYSLSGVDAKSEIEVEDNE